MRIITHAILSITRKPLKAILLFFILLVIFSLVFTGIIITNSIDRSKVSIRNGLGAIVELQPDYIKAMNDKLSSAEYQTKLQLTRETAESLSRDPAVKSSYLSESATGMSDKLKSGVNLGDDGGGIVMSSSIMGGNGEAMFMLNASNQEVPLSFAHGNLKLVEGRHRNETDANRDTAIISTELAGKNNLAVGDKITLSSMPDKKTRELEIIGIYTGGESFSADTMYVSPETCRAFNGESTEGSSLSSVHFVLQDPLQVDGFMDRNQARLPSEYMKLDAANSEYTRLTRPLDLMSLITKLLLWVVFIAGALIVIAIVTLFIRDRRFEIGLLLSNGMPKVGIVTQFVLELLLVACLAFGVSAATSRLTSAVAADWISAHQLVEDKNPSASDSVFMFGDNAGITGKVSMEDVAQNFNVDIDAGTMGKLTLVCLGLLLIAATAPLSVILAFRPRESLQG